MRRLRLVAISLLVMLVAAYALAWGYAAQRVHAGLEQLAADVALRGGSADWRTMTVGGFPFSVTATAEGVELALSDGLRWTADRVVARAQPWRWQHIALALGEEQTVRGPDATPFDARASGGEGAIRLNGRAQPVAAELTLRDFALDLPALAERPAVDLALGTVTVGVEQDPPRLGPLTVHLDARDILLPQAVQAPLGRQVARLAFSATSAPPPPTVATAPALAAWQAAGGRLALDRLMLDWASLSLSGAGVGGLDAALQPQGRLDVEISGLQEGVAALAESGALAPRDAAIAMAGVGLLGGGDPNRPVALPLTVSDGMLRLGPIPLGRLPAIVWPGSAGP